MIVPLFRVFRRRVVRDPPPPLRIAVLLAVILAYGTTGFLYFEIPAKPDLSWTDAFWWSIVTVTTVGYGDFFPTTLGGRFLVAAPLMFFGIGLLGYVLSYAATSLVEAKSRELTGMAQTHLRDHLVIVNMPNLEKVERVVDELRSDSELGAASEIVLVDEHLEALPPSLTSRGLSYVRGNPTRDETLKRASVDAASHAIVLSKTPGDPHSDDLNLAIVLSIEARARGVRTVVECVDASSEELFRKAGADRIVCASRFDAHFISSEVLHPGMSEVLDELLTVAGQQLQTTPVASGTFGGAADAARKEGHIAIGVLRDGSPRINVPQDFALREGDRLVTIGGRRLSRAEQRRAG